MSEGIIDLHHIICIIYYFTCINVMSRRVVMVARGYVMTADNHVSRGSPLIGAARQRFLPGELVWAASWLMELGRRFQREFCDVKIY